MRIAVVGGGILGVASALALAEARHDVTLLERGTLACEATSKAAGILSTMTWNDDDCRLIAATRGAIGEVVSLAMAEGAREARGAWRPAPSLCVARGDGLRALDRMQERLERLTEETERLDHRRAAREYPAVRFEPGDEALVAQEDGVIEAGDLFVALRTRLAGEGVEVRENTPVARLAVEDDRCSGWVDGAGGTHAAEAVVVAGGPWTARLVATAGVTLPVQAYRTQLASLAVSDAADVPIVHDLTNHFYVRPESDASVLAGDGTQLRPFDPDDYDQSADFEFRESLASRVVARFTHGAEALLRTGWAGLCVATPDRRPLCGPVHGLAGLHVLTGDNGFGLMRGLALGERLGQAVAGRVHPETDPRRFGASLLPDFEMREGYGDP